jgi:hypothetical protein
MDASVIVLSSGKVEKAEPPFSEKLRPWPYVLYFPGIFIVWAPDVSVDQG